MYSCRLSPNALPSWLSYIGSIRHYCDSRSFAMVSHNVLIPQLRRISMAMVHHGAAAQRYSLVPHMQGRPWDHSLGRT